MLETDKNFLKEFRMLRTTSNKTTKKTLLIDKSI